MTNEEKQKLWGTLRNADAVNVDGEAILTNWTDDDDSIEYNWIDSDCNEFDMIIVYSDFAEYCEIENNRVVTKDSEGFVVTLHPFKFIDLV